LDNLGIIGRENIESCSFVQRKGKNKRSVVEGWKHLSRWTRR